MAVFYQSLDLLKTQNMFSFTLSKSAFSNCFASTTIILQPRLFYEGEKFSMPKFSGMSDADIVAWMTNFISVASTNPERYGTTTEQIVGLTTKRDDLAAKMVNRKVADETARAAVAAQQASRQSGEPDCSYLNTIIKANPNIADEDKKALGIEPNKPPTYTPPTVPQNLTVNGFEDGRNVLRWKRGENKPNTLFIIECKLPDDDEFYYVDTTSQISFEHQGMIPGVRAVYRVKAKRGGEESEYSNEATVY